MEEVVKIRLNDIMGTELVEDFQSFDITEIQDLLAQLQSDNAIDLAHADMAQLKCLYCANLLSEYLGRIIKTSSYLEGKITSEKNKVSLLFEAPDVKRTTIEMKKWAGETSPQVEDLQIKLSKAKAAKAVLEKKYEIIIKSHHYFKELSQGYRKSFPLE